MREKTLSRRPSRHLRLHVEQEGIRVDDANRERTANWPPPESCTRCPPSPAVPRHISG